MVFRTLMTDTPDAVVAFVTSSDSAIWKGNGELQPRILSGNLDAGFKLSVLLILSFPWDKANMARCQRVRRQCKFGGAISCIGQSLSPPLDACLSKIDSIYLQFTNPRIFV